MSGKSLQQTTSADNFSDAFSKRLKGKGTGQTRNIFKKDIRRLSNTYNFNTTK